MNLQNKITVSMMFLISLILIILTIDFNWGEINIGNNSLPVTQLVAGIIFIIASITDRLDGYIARKYNLITNMGKFLYPLADKLLVSAAFIMLIELQDRKRTRQNYSHFTNSYDVY